MVGCTLKWNRQTPSEQKAECESVEDLLKFDNLYEKLDYWEQQKIVNLTGCLTPCSYTEFTLAAPPIDVDLQGDGLHIFLTSTVVTRKTEVQMYPIESLVAEFGGALGLFIGFSFMTIWDILEACYRYFESKFKPSKT